MQRQVAGNSWGSWLLMPNSVMASSGTAQIDATFCPTFLDQQQPLCWGGKLRLCELSSGGNRVSV